MECKFRVGQSVTPIKRPTRILSKETHPIMPKMGQILTIRDIIIDPPTGLVGLRFDEIKCGIHPILRMECGFVACEFRPLTDITIFQNMLTKQPIRKMVEVE